MKSKRKMQTAKRISPLKTVQMKFSNDEVRMISRALGVLVAADEMIALANKRTAKVAPLLKLMYRIDLRLVRRGRNF